MVEFKFRSLSEKKGFTFVQNVLLLDVFLMFKLLKYSLLVLQKQPPEVFYNKRPEACNFIKKETLAQVFSCEFCEISKNTFFTEHLRTTASGLTQQTHTIISLLFIFVLIIFNSRFIKSVFKPGSFHNCYLNPLTTSVPLHIETMMESIGC